MPKRVIYAKVKLSRNRGNAFMQTRQKIQWTIDHLGKDPYILARTTGVPVRVITDLLWGRVTIDHLRFIDAERLAVACDQRAPHPAKI